MKITFRQGGDNTLKCVNQLLDKMTLDVFNSLLKKEYVKPETDVYETLVSHLIMESAVVVGGQPGGTGGSGGGAGTGGGYGEDDPDNPMIPTDANVAVVDFEEEEEEDVLVWGLSWFKYMWQ